MIRHAVTVALALGLAARDPGCGSSTSSSSDLIAPCTRDRDCRGGLVCDRGVCIKPRPSSDGGSEPDAGTADAGETDATAFDSTDERAQ
ncbi:hypothetical protein LVJ94_15870 [Pendulispora rubella]|uniref:Dickkopf N-terminal cysteine-rich domain-containing protein n=1 Tax=Pendulispora rubella TaxID=2741070 RepID=A0ABZ2LCP5_9BACT